MICREVNGIYMEENTLIEAFQLEAIDHPVIAVVGAGGKTTTMFRLAKEYAERGKCVIATTSTHIAHTKGYPVAIIEKAEEICNLMGSRRQPGIWVAAGSYDTEKDKLGSMELAQLEHLADYCDVLLVEADGSKRLPLKAPAEYEPVLPGNTNVVIGCAGLSCIGKTWKESCFRRELALELLNEQYGESEKVKEEQPIRPKDVAEILCHARGTKKHVNGQKYCILCNQADHEDAVRNGEEIAAYIRKKEEGKTVPVAVVSWMMDSRERERYEGRRKNCKN